MANLPRRKVQIRHRTAGSEQMNNRHAGGEMGRERGKGWREQRWSPLENNSCHAHTCAQGNMLSILLVPAACLARPCAPITQPGAGSVWSPRRWQRHTAHNTIDHNLSALACAVCTPMCFFSRLVCLCRHGRHVREQAKAQFMKSFICRGCRLLGGWQDGWGVCKKV